MSHIVQIKTEVRDAASVAAACQRLQLPEPVHRTVQFFSGQATGLAVELPGWRYPVVCDLASGQVQLDHFENRWGEQRRLDAFLQTYAIERTRLECRRQGHSLIEQPLADGSVRLVIQLGEPV